MRQKIALLLGLVLGACSGQSVPLDSAMDSSDPEAAQAALDAQAILQGMAQARGESERVARVRLQPEVNPRSDW
ncbi:MAG: hypothetical protein JO227_19165 [Acetobacteraceae bacterium]|nr:hypothetical protein [Acetobacteraceae bacterium]